MKNRSIRGVQVDGSSFVAAPKNPIGGRWAVSFMFVGAAGLLAVVFAPSLMPYALTTLAGAGSWAPFTVHALAVGGLALAIGVLCNRMLSFYLTYKIERLRHKHWRQYTMDANYRISLHQERQPLLPRWLAVLSGCAVVLGMGLLVSLNPLGLTGLFATMPFVAQGAIILGVVSTIVGLMQCINLSPLFHLPKADRRVPAPANAFGVLGPMEKYSVDVLGLALDDDPYWQEESPRPTARAGLMEQKAVSPL